MSEQLPAKVNHLSHQHRDDIPKLGDWFWVRDSDEDETPMLMCVNHLASNHVVFGRESGRGGWSNKTRYRDLLRLTNPEPNWKEHLEFKLKEKQLELQDTIKQLALTYAAAGMDDSAGEQTLLPSLVRVEPEQAKAALVELKNNAVPEVQKRVDEIMEEITGLMKSITLPMKAQFSKMKSKMKEVDSRIFALELYAGLAESVKRIADGKPAPKETPITVRQMMLYMDEETLFDLNVGGMDWKRLEEFDEWLAKPVNRDRIVPEQRCIVAMRVRRHQKDYPVPRDIGGFFALLDDMEKNMKTYLVMRNGEQLFRLVSDVDFSPRLIPLRSEFDSPFMRKRWGGFGVDEKNEPITPDDLEYDEHASERKEQVMRYNRVLFLIQGLLDRSNVFSPHLPINMMDDGDLETKMRWMRDEEDSLPSANPPKWEEYRDGLNASLKVGDTVWCNHVAVDEDGELKKDKRGYNVNRRPSYCEVTAIKRDRSLVRLSWPWGYRWGYEKPDGWGGYHGRYGQWPVARMCHDWVPMESVIHVAKYVPGDFKRFLCDRYIKGAYLEWAPHMFAAEQWHLANAKPEGGWKAEVMKFAEMNDVTVTEHQQTTGDAEYEFTAPKGMVFSKKWERYAAKKENLTSSFRVCVSASDKVKEMKRWKSALGILASECASLKEGEPNTTGTTHC